MNDAICYKVKSVVRRCLLVSFMFSLGTFTAHAVARTDRAHVVTKAEADSAYAHENYQLAAEVYESLL